MLRLTRGASRQTHLFIVVLLFGVMAVAAPLPVLAGELAVQVRETPLRAAPGPFARVLQSLPYGTTVEVKGREGGWSRVAARESRPGGWVHDAALTDGALELDAGGADVGAGVSEDEIALAGKGFGPEVEARYQADAGLDFSWVDRMEREFGVRDDTRRRFLMEGNLDVPE